MYVPAHTCPNDAYSVLGSTLARVLTPAPLLVETVETDAERQRWWFPLVVTGVGRYVPAIGTGTRIVVVVIIIPQTDSMCEARPRRVLRVLRVWVLLFTYRYWFVDYYDLIRILLVSLLFIVIMVGNK